MIAAREPLDGQTDGGDPLDSDLDTPEVSRSVVEVRSMLSEPRSEGQKCVRTSRNGRGWSKHPPQGENTTQEGENPFSREKTPPTGRKHHFGGRKPLFEGENPGSWIPGGAHRAVVYRNRREVAETAPRPSFRPCGEHFSPSEMVFSPSEVVFSPSPRGFRRPRPLFGVRDHFSPSVTNFR